MDMKPEVGEPDAGPWQAESLEGVVGRLLPAAGHRPNRPWIVAVDGRSGAGKTTLVDRLLARVPDSAVVHTDDVAWHLSFFDWADELRDGVLEPLLQGEAVHYRPPGWVARDRSRCDSSARRAFRGVGGRERIITPSALRPNRRFDLGAVRQR